MTPPMTTPLVEARDVSLSLMSGGQPLQVLKNINLAIQPGEVVATVGPSGSGKTSLMMVLAGLQRPTSGQVLIDGRDISGLGEDQLARVRRGTVGILFQNFHLIPTLTAIQNVSLALEIAETGGSRTDIRARATAALEEVGLGHRLDHRPSVLSGGEQQRVGLARAMVTRPRLMLADEPTGNLDQESGERVIKLMFDLARQHGTAMLLITHDPGLADRADRVLVMNRGQLTIRERAPAA